MNNFFIWIICGLLIICLLLTIIFLQIRNKQYIEGFEEKLPMTIWMYWESKNNQKRPAYLDLCLKTVLKNCKKNFKINILNEKTIYRYLPNIRRDLDKKLSIPQKTDYYRYYLLYKYGGAWIDFDTIVMKNLKPLVDKLKFYDYVGAGCHYKNCKNTGYPKPINGIMISRKNTEFMKLCIKECDHLLDNHQKIKNFYFKLGRENMWKNISYLNKSKNWTYYHLDSKCLERDSKDIKLRNYRFISNENIDKKCLNKMFLVPIYNTAPGFPQWFKKMSENEIMKSNMLISKLFRKALL